MLSKEERDAHEHRAMTLYCSLLDRGFPRPPMEWPTWIPLSLSSPASQLWWDRLCRHNTDFRPSFGEMSHQEKSEWLNHALVIASRHACPAITDFLLAQGADPLFSSGQSLRHAVENRHFDVLSKSIEVAVEKHKMDFHKIATFFWDVPSTDSSVRQGLKTFLASLWKSKPLERNYEIPKLNEEEKAEFLNDWLRFGVQHQRSSVVHHALVLGADPLSARIAWEDVQPLLRAGVVNQDLSVRPDWVALQENLQRDFNERLDQRNRLRAEERVAQTKKSILSS